MMMEETSRIVYAQGMQDMSPFDQLMLEIYRYKRIMNILQNENEELRRSLSELHAGRGIFLVIENERYPLLCPQEE
jgi:hypothetical protein